MTDFFARIVHLMYNSGKIALPGQPMRPQGEFALNTAPQPYGSDSKVVIANKSPYGLNGAQLVLRDADDYTGPLDDTHTVQGDRLVITLGRIAPGTTVSVTVPMRGGDLHGVLRSSTAQPVRIGRDDDDRR